MRPRLGNLGEVAFVEGIHGVQHVRFCLQR